jgi:hypothetical protein
MQYRPGGHVDPSTKNREGFKACASSFIAWAIFTLIGVLVAGMAATVIAFVN